MRERADLEREYAKNLEKIAKTAVKRLKKAGQSFYGAGSSFAAPGVEATDAQTAYVPMPPQWVYDR